jgi:hypothetical protein
MSPEFVGNAAGAVSQVTLCVTAFADQLNVIVPVVIVSGVGENELFATVIVVE